MNKALWTIQILLSALFLFSGISKFVTPAEEMAKQMPPWISISFVLFIGVCEILGGIGLILPSLLKIKPGLTPLAASGLVIIMIGAVVTTLMMGMGATAIIPLVTGVLVAFVAYGRWRLVPITK